ncbi:MAG: PTS sugar transporter subunit IIA [Anaerolineales bacterium]|nr:PTS sugar transporter subunit IIA [Anaerolineales bacterium]
MSAFNLLAPASVHLGLQAHSAEEVIRLLGGELRSHGKVKADFVEATLAREATNPTGLVLGGRYNAALPHVDLEYVNQSAIALAVLKDPVTFHSMVDQAEEVPVQLVIMLALVDPKAQINALGQIAEVLQNPEIVEKLVHATTSKEIFLILGQIEGGQ